MSYLIKNLLSLCLFILVSSNLVAQTADLKLEYTTSPNPAIIAVGDTLQVRYEVSNTGLADATGSQMSINLDGGFQVVESMPTAGTFASNVWNIGTVPKEESEILLLFITKTSEGLGTLEAEISQMTGGGPDPDSTPNNQDAGEDDFQSFCISTIKEFYQPQIVTLSAGNGMTGVQWYRNDTLIVGADSIDYDATESGIYYFNADGAPCELGGCCPIELKEVPPPPCSVTATVSEIACNDNGTPTIDTDDYIEFKITTEGISLGSTYSLSADMGTITTLGGAAVTGLTYGADSLFRMQNGSAGAGDIQIVLTDSDSPTCKDTLDITDTGVCSTPVCNMALSVSPGTCDASDNTYDVAGMIVFAAPPTSGNLIISVDGTATQILSAPFNSPHTISITGLTSDGLQHSITAEFTAEAACRMQMNYTAPLPCMVSNSCAISATVNTSSCEMTNNTYEVSGNLTFSDAPTSGTLKVGIGPFEQIFTAPFTSPQAYSIGGLVADGSSHILMVTFSEDAFCRFDTTYIAPAGCDPVACGITATATPGVCTANRFDLTGAITFSNAPSTGMLTVSLDGKTQTFAAPFTSPQAYMFTDLLANGSQGTVVVQFSDDLACAATVDFMAPKACDMANCAVVLDLKPSACSDNTYALAGSISMINPPTTGTLTVQSGGTTYLTVSMPASSPIGFNLPGLPANGQTLVFDAVFSADGSCTDTFTVIAPTPCMGTCDVSATVADVQCNDNDTDTSSDDYTTFSLNPTGANIGATYNVTSATGPVYLLSGALANNVPYGQAMAFRLTNGSSGGGDITINIQDNSTPNCVEGPLTIPDPEVCSCEEPIGTITTSQTTCNGSDSNTDGMLIITNLTLGTRVNYSTGTTYSGDADYDDAFTIGTLPDTIVQNLVNPTDSQAYTIRIFNERTGCFVDTTLYLHEKECMCTDPILTDLTDESICIGENFAAANVTTSVTNSIPVTYQWFNNDGTDNAGTAMIAGQTTATLTSLPTTAGSYSYKVVATNTRPGGCSVEKIVNLEIIPTATGLEVYNGCRDDGYSVVVGPTTYNQNNPTGMETLTAANGCDSVVTISLVYKPNAVGTLNYDGCQGDGYSVLVGSTIYNEANPTGMETITAVNGCDSVVTINLVFKPNATGTELYDGCQGDGYSVVVGSTTYNEANPTGMETLVAANGCDSVVTINLTYKPNAVGMELYDGCEGDGYEVVVGSTTYNEANPTGIETLVSTNGCDSVVTITLVYKPNAVGMEVYDGCQGDGYSVVVGSTTYNEANPGGMETLTAADGCDSVVTINLTYKPNTVGIELYDGCEGDGYSVVVGTTTYNEANPTGMETLTAADGCDSVVTVNLVFKPTKMGAELYDGCEGDGYSVVVGSTTYNEANPAGMETLTAADGCDSIVTISLVYKVNSTGTLTYDGCQDDGYEVVVGSTTYNEANPTGVETITAANGCDSVVTISLVFKPTVTGLELYDGCMGDGYEKVIGSMTYNEANPSGMETLTAANGCDSVVTVSFVYKANTTGTEEYDGCQGDGYEVVVGSTTYNEANPTGMETLTAANGCDSVVTIHLVYKPNTTGVELYDGCMGDGYEVMIGGITFNEANPSGMAVLTAANGCDSVVTVSFVYKANTSGIENYDGCMGDGYEVVVGSTTYNEANPSGMETLTAANGCDSVVTVNLIFKPNATGTEVYDGCQGDGYEVVVGSTTYNEANPTGSETLPSANGCDSIVTINLVFKPNATGTEMYDGCQGDGYEVVVGSTTYNEANPSGMETLTAADGCDSMVTVNLVFKPNTTGTELYNGCQGDGYEVVVGSTTYNEANPSGMETLTAANGCDSVVTVGLVFQSATTGMETYNGCQNDGYFVVVGSTTYNEANPMGTETLTGANGCDSVVTINLTFREGVTGLEFYDGCKEDGYEVVVGSTTYNQANPFGMETLTAADGCDSVVTVSLVYKERPTGVVTYEGCEGDGYEVIVGSTTYNEVNPTGIETFPRPSGCDSVVVIELVFNPTKTSAVLYNGCENDGYEVVVGTTTYNEANPTGMETLTASDGCDSVVTIALIYKPNATGTETYEGCVGDGYSVVVGSMTYNESNRTGMETLIAANGCDSIVSVNLVFKPSTMGTEVYSGCEGDGYEVVVGSTTYNEATPTGTEILTASNGCDSVVMVDLVFNSQKTTLVNYEGCFNDGYEVTVGSTIYNEANPTGLETLTAASGCDSIVTINLVFNTQKTTTINYEGCEEDGYEVTVGSTTYNEANPAGMETLTAASGCDSIVTINLVFLPNKTNTVTYDGCEDDGYHVTVGTTVYNETNPIGTEILTAANGCDSTVTVNLVFMPNTTGIVTYEGCENDGYSVTVGTTTYDENNPTGTEVLTAANGCDSTVTISLVFHPEKTNTITYEGCFNDGYEVTVGTTTYDENNPTGTEVLTTANGCDSTVTVHLVFNQQKTNSVTYEGCENDGFSITVGTTTYDENNPTGIDTLTAASGCDSIVTINLVFLPNTTSTITYEGCENDGYSVLVGTTIYDVNNPIGTEVLTNAHGCDSTVTISLIFNEEKASEIMYEGCENDGYEIAVNGTIYSEANPKGEEQFTAVNGCDSVVTIDLTFLPEEAGACDEFDLAIEKSTDATVVQLGDLVVYQIKVTNEGDIDAYNIGISDFIPEGMSLADENWTATGDIARFNQPISFLPAGLSFNLYITLKVDLDFTGTSLVNFAEISEADDDDDPTNTPPTDKDSTPDEDRTNPDEDDDDSAVINVVEPNEEVFDLALIETLAPSQSSMVNPGDEVDLKITVFNQGTIATDTIEITQYLPADVTLNEANPQGWIAENDSTAIITLLAGDQLPAGGLAPDSMIMVIIQVVIDENTTAVKLTPHAEISDDGSNDDNDSTPDDDRTNDSGGEPNTGTDNASDQIPPVDEDDHDPVQLMLREFDLALTEELLTEGPVQPGDSITGKIKVFNQGEIAADNIKLFAYIPEGLQLDDDRWTIMNDTTAMLILSVANDDLPTGGLMPEEMTMITIGFTIDPTFMDTCLITYAEIGNATDENGRPTHDVDSTPDGDNTNDTGGEVHTPTDNQIFSIPPMDEDDHDPMKIAVEQTFDLALEKSTDSMLVRVGDLVTYQIEITNEGSLNAYNIGVTDHLPIGMSLQDNNWTAFGDTLRLNTPIAFLGAGQSSVVEITLQVLPSTENLILMNFAEISSADDDDDPDNEPPVDKDSTPDEDKTNEDEDDDDAAVVTVIPPDVFDLAVIETLAPEQSGMVRPGATVDFKITVFNQGNISADTIKLIQYLPDGLTLNTANPQGWTAMDDSTAMILLTTGNGLPANGLAADSMIMVMIQTVVSTTPTSNKLTAYVEISEDGETNNDHDSTPDDNRTNDIGGVSNSDTDNAYDQIPPMDEDDHDPVQIMLQSFDLALTEALITEGDIEPGDNITAKIKVFNQGDIPADNIKLFAYIPTGMSLEDDRWALMDDSTAMTTLTTVADDLPLGGLAPNTMTMLTIDFVVDTDFREECLITYAEIGDATDENGDAVIDVDSTPDDDRTNDTGGEVGTITDNEVEEIPPVDEDDHDPVKIVIKQTFDLALIIELATDQKMEVPDNDTVCFNITVINQGTQDAYDIGIVNYVPFGLTYDAILNQRLGINWQADSTYHLAELLVGDTAIIPIKFMSNMEAMDSIVVDTAEIYFATTEDGSLTNAIDVDSKADDINDDFIGGDNLLRNERRDEDDHDYVYIVPLDVVDPIGFIYADKTGKIVKGGTISVTTPPGGVAFIIEDGSTGMYQWFTNGVQGEYVMTYTHPNGAIISPNCNAQTGVYDPTGRDGDATDMDGDGTNGIIQLGTIDVNADSTYLLNPTCSDNPYYLRFFLQSGDPIIDGNNIAIQESFIGSIICEDENDNGQPDPGEAGIPNALVYLYHCTDTINPIDSTLSNAQGEYRFDGLSAGNYMVQFTAPDGYRLPVDAIPTNVIAARGGFSECIDLTTGQCDTTTTVCMKACTDIVATVSASNIIQGESITISLTGGPEFIWSANAGITNTTTSVATLSPSISTTYTVTVNDTYGCSQTLNIPITVTPLSDNYVRIADPCNCTTESLNDTLVFTDKITIFSLTPNENWTLVENKGIYSNGNLVSLGTSFSPDGIVDDYYTYSMPIQHLDVAGYMGRFSNGTEELTAMNTCFADQSCTTTVTTDPEGTPGPPVITPVIIIPSTPTPLIDTLANCSGIDFRSEGAEDNTLYADDSTRNNVITICAQNAWQSLMVTFTEFDLAPGDTLYVFEGRDTLPTQLIGRFSGNGVSQTGGWVASNCDPKINPHGCLTFQFKTNGDNAKGLGWRSTVTCQDDNITLTPPNDLSAKLECDSAFAIFEIKPLTVTADCGTIQDSQIVRIFNTLGELCLDTCLADADVVRDTFGLGSYLVTYKLKSDTTKTAQSVMTVQGPSLVCNDEINIPLGSACSIGLTPDDLLENACDTLTDTIYYYITLKGVDKNGNDQILATGGGRGGNYPMVTKDMLDQCGGSITAVIEKRYYEGLNLSFCNNGTQSESCEVKVNVIDQSAPVFTNLPPVDTFVTCSIDLTQAGLGLPTPDAVDNCGDAIVVFVGAQITSQGSNACDTTRATVTWNAMDECGNTTTATQNLVFVRPSIDDIVKTGKVNLSCDSDTGAEAVTAMPRIKIGRLKNGILIPSDTIALDTAAYTCGFILQSNDVEIPAVDCGKKVFRYWSILDWCDATGPKPIDTTFIEFKDTKAPTFVAGSNATQEIALDHFACTYDVNKLMTPAATDNCSTPTVRLAKVSRIEDGAKWEIPTTDWTNLDCDTFELEWIAEDLCHEQTINDTVTQTIIIKDVTKPSVVCTDKLHVSLGRDEVRVHYNQIDAGSFDACGIVQYEVSRDEENWDSIATFSCEDLHQENKVYLRVTDAKGNQNSCWSTVVVEDKIAPICSDLPTMTGTCDEGHGDELLTTDSNDNGLMDNEEWVDLSPEQATDFNTKYGNPNCSDNVTCQELVIQQQYQKTEKACGIATIKRRYRAIDWNGAGMTSGWAEQIINIESKADWSITFPADWKGVCGEEVPNSSLEIVNGACDLMAYEVEEKVFTTVEDACLKVVRTFTIINWCTYQAGEDGEVISRVENEHGMVTETRTITSEGFEKVGKLTYIQVLKLQDDTPPIITVEETETCISTDDCSDIKSFTINATDCNEIATQNLVYNWTISVNGGQIGSGTGNTFDYPVVTNTDYLVEWTVADNCGNMAKETVQYGFEDCKKPAPYCIHGVAVELMPDAGMIQVWAKDIELGSADNCTPKDRLKYRIWHTALGDEPTSFEDVLALPEVITFDCAYLGSQTVNLYVIDEADNWDFCITYVNVQDNMEACQGEEIPAGMALVDGTITNWKQQTVERVLVHAEKVESTINDYMTKEDGHYGFELEMHNTYTIRPEKDDRPLNGVSTFDLVLMAKHILGAQPFENPYQMIAADVNQSGTITAFDMVQIRQLILNIKTEFSNAPSWKFVEANYEFTTDQPMSENYPEVMQVADLTHDMTADFVAIKMGDVNGNARPSSLIAAEDRSTTTAFEVMVTDRVLKAGESYTVEFTTTQLANIQGYQLTLGYEDLSVTKLKGGVVKAINFGTHKMNQGMITTSYNQQPVTSNQQPATLFTLELTAQKDGKLSEQLSLLNRPTAIEAYDENGALMDVKLTFTSPSIADEFELFQNQPNPFHEETMIGFYLPGDSEIQLILRDETGRILKSVKENRKAGYNTIKFHKEELTNGFIYYHLNTKFGTKAKKMLKLN